jgi:hypothetical protein
MLCNRIYVSALAPELVFVGPMPEAQICVLCIRLCKRILDIPQEQSIAKAVMYARLREESSIRQSLNRNLLNATAGAPNGHRETHGKSHSGAAPKYQSVGIQPPSSLCSFCSRASELRDISKLGMFYGQAGTLCVCPACVNLLSDRYLQITDGKLRSLLAANLSERLQYSDVYSCFESIVWLLDFLDSDPSHPLFGAPRDDSAKYHRLILRVTWFIKEYGEQASGEFFAKCLPSLAIQEVPAVDAKMLQAFMTFSSKPLISESAANELFAEQTARDERRARSPNGADKSNLSDTI